MRSVFPLLVLLGACNACNGNGYESPGAVLPESDEELASFAPGVTPAELLPVIDQGLATRGKGPEYVRFVVIRAGDRHGAGFRRESFTVTVGAGVTLPAGALLVRRVWGTSGQVDGTNEQPEQFGVAIAVEPGAPRPYAAPVGAAVKAFVDALVERVAVHPDCVLAMADIPYTNEHAAAGAERELAAAARAGLAPPPASGALTIGGKVRVTFERRNTTSGIAVGMMLRRGFDGEDRGMLFEYPHPTYRHFWMKNCLIPIDLAYINNGKIEQLLTMKAGTDTPQNLLPRYDSDSTVKFALEMPAGWFERNGVKVGDSVQFE